MFIVTGGAGFIGSNIVKSLNDRGITDILVVDNLENTEKIKNLADLRIVDYMDKTDFFDFMLSAKKIGKVDAVFHEGACSDTMATDGKYVLHNNFTYSKMLLDFCERHNAQFIYASSASVYGAGTRFVESPKYESALNAYAWSKLLFDCHIRSLGDISVQCCGLRYFNVYGPRELHKGRMASVAWHFRNQLNDSGSVKLFSGTDGYGDGQQLRDFVYVDDVVNVNMFLLDNPDIRGIFNVGTGRCQSFNDVALASINYVRRKLDQDLLTLEDAVAGGQISYIPMPAALEGKYQSYTQANLDRLRNTGYDREFDNVGQGVDKYMTILDQND
jgi:ADP-L-glycero-D-manno-heptose 6-epimerase